MDRPVISADTFLADHALGRPGIEGRWQPTRAGVVNSWAWADETLLFGDGWLALTGPNGSGKSLTASMLITVLLDADTSQTALSVSGKAAGTLVSRHTNRNDKEDRTGVWWLEYGLRDAQTGETKYLTTGLWLRAVSGNLQRAFFLAEGRVGEDFVLQRDRDPQRIDDLARQLADLDGEIYTASSALRPKVQAHLRVVGDERGYRDAVRTRLFAPLDEVQFEALVGVLRSLRSLRTAEAISPSRMRDVLTDALPALDPDQLVIVAETMERIADLEGQLKQTNREIELLTRTDELYRRYISAVVRLEAAALIAANTEFDARTREETDARRQLEAAEAAETAAVRELDEVKQLLSQQDGHREAATTALRDHAGAELPLLEQLAEELTSKAAAAADRAELDDADAQETQQRAAESADAKMSGTRHLAALSEVLLATAVEIGAESAVERLIAAARQSQGDPEAVAEAERLAATPLAWAESRIQRIREVEEALHAHRMSQSAQQSAASALRLAENHEDDLRRLAITATDRRLAAEASLLEQLDQWSNRALSFGPVPAALVTAEDGDRLDPDALVRWLLSVAAVNRECIDLTGKRRTADRDAVLAETTRDHAVEAASASETAERHAEAAALSWEAAQQRARGEAEETERRKAAALGERDLTATMAAAAVAEAQEQVTAGSMGARDVAASWLRLASRWHADLRFLGKSEIPLPGDFVDVDPDEWAGRITVLRLAVARAHQEAAAELIPLVTNAEVRCTAIEEEVSAIRLELREALRSAPVPVAPPWRSRRAADGVPLWSAVEFAEHLSTDESDKLEGALLVSGLLDALLREDGGIVVGDVTITGSQPVSGRTLADALQADPDSGMAAERVERALRAVPLDSAGTDVRQGTFAMGVLTAAAPDGYRAAFIGRSARERARESRVARLREQLATSEERLLEARNEGERQQDNLRRAEQERDSFPASTALDEARERVVGLRRELTRIELRSGGLVREAEHLFQRVLDVLAEESAERELRSAKVQLAWEEAVRTSSIEQAKAARAAETAREAAEIQQQSHDILAAALHEQASVDSEQAAFPELDGLRQEHRLEDDAGDKLSRAREQVLGSQEEHRAKSGLVRETLRELNRAALLPTGTLLPVDRGVLTAYNDTVLTLKALTGNWSHAAERTTSLWLRELADSDEAEKRAARARRARQEAVEAQLAAMRQEEHVTQVRRLYGADYEHLQVELHEINRRISETRTRSDALTDRQTRALGNANTAKNTLAGIAPRRISAEHSRDGCLATLGRLVTEEFAALPSDIPSTETGKPGHVTAGLGWARRLLADTPASGERQRALEQAVSKSLALLERNVLVVSRDLAAFDRQVTLFGIEGTTWRRAEIADPEAPRGQDLHEAVEDLRATAAVLMEDLSDDVKRTMKSSMFTQLKQDIMLRREAAQSLVRQISATLDRVRTGVADVGVKVEWEIREEEDAKRMVDLIQKPPSDETHDEMYTVLRQRMLDREGEPWADRVAHAFDYRAWHEWNIWVTHSSFGTGESPFKKVTNRSNPMESLSTGERRLAIMLPLLAAAWSMYSGETFRGPRLVSIDEIDAAFDEPNLRQVLALLRSWKFDVLATAPFMTPMLKEESQRLMVHEVVGSGKERITVPWLWEGRGEPKLLEPGMREDGETWLSTVSPS